MLPVNEVPDAPPDIKPDTKPAPTPLAEADLPPRLLAWYDRHRRSMPWRALPGVTPDPYAVWLSEIMLQQTTVATVVGYFATFLARWPTVTDLARAPLDDVLHAWAGLGYYARARNLHACAKAICADHGGRFPDEEATLRTLPGIGAYSAASIAAIAFNRPATVVDGNVERVMARLFAVETPLPAAKPALRAHAARLSPTGFSETGLSETGLSETGRPGDYAQALMDLGATICTPRKPRCLLCPWQPACRAYGGGDPEHYPLKTAKAARPHRHAVAFLLWDEAGRLLLRRRAETGLLGGMIEVPTTPWRAATWAGAAWAEGEEAGAAEAVAHCPIDTPTLRAIPGSVIHVFTHFSLEITVMTASPIATPPPIDGAIWASEAEIAHLALPTLMKKIRAHGAETGPKTVPAP